MLYREAGQFKTTYSQDMAMFPIRQDRIALVLLLAFAFVGVPLLAKFHIWPFGSEYMLRAILVPFLILSLAAVGVNILVGYCGQISLGSGAFMAVGAYSAYKFGTGIHIPLALLGFNISIPPLPVLPSILLGGLMAALVGILFGVPSLRIKGLYLAVATLAAQFFCDWVFLRVPWFTNYSSSGSVNAPALDFFGLLMNSPTERYFVCLTFVAVFALLAKNLVRGNIGRQWMAIRDMDIAAELMGIRLLRTKLLAFAVSSYYCGVAGAMMVFLWYGGAEYDVFNINQSFFILFMVIIGGLGSLIGSFFGAALIFMMPIGLGIMLPALLGPFGIAIGSETIEHLRFIIVGALIIFFLIVEPHGLARLWQIAKQKLRVWPFPY